MRSLKDYYPWMDAILRSICDNSQLTTETPLEDILRNPRLIVVFNHSTPLSWIPAIALLASEIYRAGGGDRVPRGIVDKWFYSNPLTAAIAKYMTQSDTHQNFNQILQSFQQESPTDLVIFPEGANSFFGDPSEIGEFRSSRFVELSVRSGAPILLAVHQGSEGWSLPLHLPAEIGAVLAPYSKFFSAGLLLGKVFHFPLPMNKIQNFQMHLKLYIPELYESDLATDPTERRMQLDHEAEKIRTIMSEMKTKETL